MAAILIISISKENLSSSSYQIVLLRCLRFVYLIVNPVENNKESAEQHNAQIFFFKYIQFFRLRNLLMLIKLNIVFLLKITM